MLTILTETYPFRIWRTPSATAVNALLNLVQLPKLYRVHKGQLPRMQWCPGSCGPRGKSKFAILGVFLLLLLRIVLYARFCSILSHTTPKIEHLNFLLGAAAPHTLCIPKSHAPQTRCNLERCAPQTLCTLEPAPQTSVVGICAPKPVYRVLGAQPSSAVVWESGRQVSGCWRSTVSQGARSPGSATETQQKQTKHRT